MKDTQPEHLPWRLTLHYTVFPLDQLIQMDLEQKVLLDTFVNSIKEADFIRNGTAKVAMGMSKADSDTLWLSVQTRMHCSSPSIVLPPSDRPLVDNLPSFNSINNKFLNPPGSVIRHAPIKIYLPSAPQNADAISEDAPQAGRIRVVQGLVAPFTPSRAHSCFCDSHCIQLTASSQVKP